MDSYKLLTTESDLEAQNLARLLDQGNKDRQRVEAQAFEEAVSRVEEDLSLEESRFLVVDSPDWHEGVLGIVASRLVERYHRPAIVISIKNGLGKGSGRSIPSFSIYESVRRCEELLINFGGHSQACGLTIQKENVALLRHRLQEISAEVQAVEEIRTLEIQAELGSEDLNKGLLADLEKLSPFGPGNARPLFASRNFHVKGEIKKRGKDTTQCWMSDEKGRSTCEVIGFRSYAKWASQKSRGPFDIAYQPALKNFNGITSIQLELEDWQLSTSASGL